MKNKSFTLIEIIVAVAIFSIFIGTVVGIFVFSIHAQRKALAYQELLDQTSYVMEYMSRSLRMAKKDLNTRCIGKNENYSVSGSSINFKNYKDECQEFFLTGTRLQEYKNIWAGNIYLTSDNLQVNQFNINFLGETQNDNLQPRVTIFLDIESTRISENPPRLQIQTTISQRNLDIME